jgi:hypothetical protein
MQIANMSLEHFSTHKVVAIVVRSALSTMHNGSSQNGGGAGDGQKLGVAHDDVTDAGDGLQNKNVQNSKSQAISNGQVDDIYAG